MQHRINALRERLVQQNRDAFFSIDSSSIAWLTGFRGSAGAVIVTQSSALLLVDFRYVEQAGEQAQDVEVLEVTGTLETRVGEQLVKLGVTMAIFESDRLTVSQFDAVSRAAESLEVFSAQGLVNDLRMVKDAGEIAKIRAAAQIADAVVLDVVTGLKMGMTEREVAARLEYGFKVRGAAKESFDTVVLFGSRSSLPHGKPSDKPLAEGDLVLIDCGCVLDGYCSDLTRTFVFGRIPASWTQEIYQCVQEAQEAALKAVKAGVRAADVDAVARGMITRAGYGSRFGHGTGHGVGLEIHENPRLNVQSEAVLAAGMVVTVEPGIYLPGQGGVRIEDTLVVTEDGCDVLTTGIPKDLKVIGA